MIGRGGVRLPGLIYFEEIYFFGDVRTQARRKLPSTLETWKWNYSGHTRLRPPSDVVFVSAALKSTRVGESPVFVVGKESVS